MGEEEPTVVVKQSFSDTADDFRFGNGEQQVVGFQGGALKGMGSEASARVKQTYVDAADEFRFGNGERRVIGYQGGIGKGMGEELQAVAPSLAMAAPEPVAEVAEEAAEEKEEAVA